MLCPGAGLAAANEGLKSKIGGGPGVCADPSSAFWTCSSSGPRRAEARAAVGVSVQELPLATLEGAPETAKALQPSRARPQNEGNRFYFRMLLIADVGRQVVSF